MQGPYGHFARTTPDRPPNNPGPDTLARLCHPGVRALRRPARTCDVDQAPCAGLARRRVLVVLGAATLRPHPGALLRLAWQRLPRLPLLRRAPAGRPPRHGRPARVGSVRRLERAARAARLGAGPVWREPAFGVGRVPASRGRGGDPGDADGGRPIRRAALAGQGVEPVRLGLVRPGRLNVHPAATRSATWCPSTSPAPRERPSADSGFTTRWVCSSPRWPWPSPTPSSPPSPGGRSTATFCR